MIKNELVKRIYSLAGIILFALLINLGSAWDDLIDRLEKPMFVKMVIGTIGLLYAYLFLVQGIYKQLNKADSWYGKQKEYIKMLIFVLLSTAVVVFIHLFVVDFLLAQRNHQSVFTEHYFNSDFWFFFIPSLLYIITLYYKPQIRLFHISKAPVLLQTSVAEPLEEEVMEKQAVAEVSVEEEDVFDKPIAADLKVEEAFIAGDLGEKLTKSELHPSIDENHELLKLWRASGDVEYLFDYFQMLLNDEKWHLEGQIPLWKAVVFERTKIITYAYFANGEKWVLHDIDNAVFDNPWVIKISNNYHLNMLYATLERKKLMLKKAHGNKLKSPKKLQKVDVLILHGNVVNVLLEVMKVNQLNYMLIISRRMFDNYENFCRLAELKKLDVEQLGDDFGRIE
ncbi:hypothetical protein [Sphingobacterium faecium]|uniref:hypothetical protein n=1 Tax=Sphingobacterium faecium TaxID=34087 RepID=UPI002468C9C2|nr:hypothetical protein [Sphingobacterium faecium]MDH5825880.1 hypothetical protein [Sphingobacterium faecium]